MPLRAATPRTVTKPISDPSEMTPPLSERSRDAPDQRERKREEDQQHGSHVLKVGLQQQQNAEISENTVRPSSRLARGLALRRIRPGTPGGIPVRIRLRAENSFLNLCGHAAQIATLDVADHIQLARRTNALDRVGSGFNDDVGDVSIAAPERHLAYQSAVG